MQTIQHTHVQAGLRPAKWLLFYSGFVTLFIASATIAQTEDTYAVRNDVAQLGTPVTTMRRWKIKKGGFDEFLQASQQGVWPYFEKIGARVVGMWQVMNVRPDDSSGGMANSGYVTEADNGLPYDEVVLVTRYASLAHWQATRHAQQLGGNGPDYEALRAALAVRRELTIETTLTFLQGFNGPNGPYYLPGTQERFVPATSSP